MCAASAFALLSRPGHQRLTAWDMPGITFLTAVRPTGTSEMEHR